MTLTTGRGSDGNTKQLFLWLANIGSSLDMAIFIAVTNNCWTVAKNCLEQKKITAAAQIPFLINLTRRPTATEAVTYIYLAETWWHVFNFHLQSSDYLMPITKDPEQSAINCENLNPYTRPPTREPETDL